MKLRFTPRALENISTIADYIRFTTLRRRSVFELRFMKACETSSFFHRSVGFSKRKACVNS